MMEMRSYFSFFVVTFFLTFHSVHGALHLLIREEDPKGGKGLGRALPNPKGTRATIVDTWRQEVSWTTT
ncbi:hypothetical protein AAHE18_13G218000 [Arachis hypogaea]